jgi:hypothetical protein
VAKKMPSRVWNHRGRGAAGSPNPGMLLGSGQIQDGRQKVRLVPSCRSPDGAVGRGERSRTVLPESGYSRCRTEVLGAFLQPEETKTKEIELHRGRGPLRSPRSFVVPKRYATRSAEKARSGAQRGVGDSQVVLSWHPPPGAAAHRAIWLCGRRSTKGIVSVNWWTAPGRDFASLRTRNGLTAARIIKAM